MENICKACLASTKVTDGDIQLAIDKLSRLKGMKFVEDSLYLSRLEKCDVCAYLEYGTTCLQCGCIVQIRAKLPDSTCPYPKDRKW
jgi:hypothetical protein